RLFFLGQGVSLIGTWMQNVAQGWLVLELTNSPFYVGLVSALGSFGVLLLTLYAGVVVDRTNKHRLVILTQSLSMLPAFALALLVWIWAVAVWHVAALAAFLGVVNAFDIPARQAFIVDLVRKQDLMNAIALNSSAFNAARVSGPAVAGLLIGALGRRGLRFVDDGGRNRGVDRRARGRVARPPHPTRPHAPCGRRLVRAAAGRLRPVEALSRVGGPARAHRRDDDRQQCAHQRHDPDPGARRPARPRDGILFLRVRGARAARLPAGGGARRA